ncbi:hypothetical protein ACX93W_14545 [Paenibacillus sp. CAU 1782]
MKNTAFRTYDQFEAAWKAENIPTPNIQYGYVRALREGRSKKTISAWLRPLPIVMAILGLGVLFLAGTQVSALVSKYILHDRDGEAVLVYEETSLERTKIDEQLRAINRKYRFIEADFERALKPGETALFLVPEAYQLDGDYSVLHNRNETFTDMQTLTQAADIDFGTPAYIPPGYQFEEGGIDYQIEGVDRNDLNQLAQEAIDAGLPYIIKPWSFHFETGMIRYNYMKEVDTGKGYPIYSNLSVGITEATGYTSVGSLQHGDIEIVDLGDGTEAIYEPSMKMLTFVLSHGGNKLQYTVSSGTLDGYEMPKEELFKFAQSLVPTSD